MDRLVDFSEIALANSGNGDQDDFELFARDFLDSLGYIILRGPSRGPDGGVDLIVEEQVKGISYSKNFKWLVSAKHYFKTGKSVGPKDEINITERLKANNCDGFMGFYSTIPSSGLKKFSEGDIEYKFYDWRMIEKFLISDDKCEHVYKQYFPKSFERFMEHHEEIKNVKLENDDLYLSVTEALAIIKINELKLNLNWGDRLAVSNFLFLINPYRKYNGKHIAKEIENIVNLILLGEENKQYKFMDSNTSTVYHICSHHFKILNKNFSDEIYIELTKEIVYSSTRFILYQSYRNEEMLPSANILNLIKFLNIQSKQFLDNSELSGFIEEQIHKLLEEVSMSTSKYSEIYKNLVSTYIKILDDRYMGIPRLDN